MNASLNTKATAHTPTPREFYEISYPERRIVSRDRLTIWASDAIANGDTDIEASDAELAADMSLVMRVLHDSGYATLRYSAALAKAGA